MKTLRNASFLERLSEKDRARVEGELAQVLAMANPEACAHLLEAAAGQGVPPEDVPGGTPLALWFLLHRPSLFRDGFLHGEVSEMDSWRHGQTRPGLDLGDLRGKAATLSAALAKHFQVRDGSGRYCTTEAYRLGDTCCFDIALSRRPQPVEYFTQRGRRTLRHVRIALKVSFAYRPADGFVQLRCPVRSEDRIAEIFRAFGTAVLGGAVEHGKSVFALDRLKEPFHPLPDAHDMESVRVKSLHLRYPERTVRRQVKLETLPGDDPAAIDELARRHLAGEGMRGELRVEYAELQIRLRNAARVKDHVIRLRHDRSNLDPTPLGARFWNCLRRWGLIHVG